MTDVVIRPERPEDAAAARAVHIDAFPVPDGEVQSVESVLVDWLREDGDVLWPLTLVAERDGQIVGSAGNFRFNESPLGMLGRLSDAGTPVDCLPREWADWVTRARVAPLAVDGFGLSTVSEAV